MSAYDPIQDAIEQLTAWLKVSSEVTTRLSGDIQLRAYGDVRVDDTYPSPLEADLERAVIEAGFATEPLRHCIQELYECLYLRMLDDGMQGFSEKEWQACQEAKRLLGLVG